MSVYTTQLRFICESLCGLDESTGYTNTFDVIKQAAPKVFNFEYPIFDTEYKPLLERKILLHYYTREICEETYGLWQLRLASLMNDIMPFYNQLYESELIKFNPLHNVDLWTLSHETDRNTKQQNITDHMTNLRKDDVTSNESSTENEQHDQKNTTDVGGSEQEITNVDRTNTTDQWAIINEDGTTKGQEWQHNTTSGTSDQTDITYNQNYHNTHGYGTTDDWGQSGSVENIYRDTTTTDDGNSHNHTKTDNLDMYSATPQGTVEHLLVDSEGNAQYLTDARNTVGDNDTWNTNASIQHTSGHDSDVTNTTQHNSGSTDSTTNEDTTDTGENNSWKNTTGTEDKDITTSEDKWKNTRTDQTTKEQEWTNTNQNKSWNENTTFIGNQTDNIKNVTWFTKNENENNDRFTTNDLQHKIDNINDYAQHIAGRNTATSYSKYLMEFRETFLNIDKLIIDELAPLFFMLY